MEAQHAIQLTAEEVLCLVVMPDEPGCSHCDEMGYENLPAYPGYLGGPLASAEAAYSRKEQAQPE